MKTEEGINSNKERVVQFRVPFQRSPTDKTDEATYCTVMQDGSYDIKLTDSSGTVLAVLDQICISHTESWVRREGPTPDEFLFSSQYDGNVKGAWQKFTRVYFQSHLFLAVNPTILFHVTASAGPTNFNCGTSRVHIGALSVDTLDPSRGSVLKKAADHGELYITGYYTDC